MHCASCTSIVSRQLKKAPGVEQSDVSLTWEQAEVTGAPEALTPQKLNPFLAKFGYAVEEIGKAQTESLDAKTLWLSGSAVLVFFLMLAELASIQLRGQMLLPEAFTIWGIFLLAGLNWLLTAPRFGRAVWIFLRSGAASMDTLIGIGTGAALLNTVLQLLLPNLAKQIGLNGPLYTDVVIVVIGFVYLGQAIERRLRRQTSLALRGMQERLQKTVLLEKDGKTQETALSLIKAGDILRVGAGAVIPVDGSIVEGSSAINESALTGESLPVEKSKGQKVFAGTLNTTGSLRIQTTAAGAQTMYGKAAESVLSASRANAGVERLTDKIAAIFVPAVLIIAVLTALFWTLAGPGLVGGELARQLAVSCTLAVLVVACPCSLGLATPTAVSATLGRLLKMGVFVRRPEIIEHLGACTHVVFDKTGTLTIGRPLVQDVQPAKDSTFDVKKLLAIAAGLESDSQHPLATAIQLHAEEQGVSPIDAHRIITHPAQGIQGAFQGRTWRIGSKEWLEELNIHIPKETAQPPAGSSTLYLAKDHTYLGSIRIQDELRPNMRITIQALQNMGKEVVLLSGDTESATAAIAKQLSISTWLAHQTPDAKAAYVRTLQEMGHHVLMVGDGINDTAALAEASVSIAVSSGSDTALSVADATVFSSAVEKLPAILQIGTFGMLVIKQNLVWAFGYNTLGIPLAAGLFYPMFNLLLSPMLAGVFMSLSSISVVANALRISAHSISTKQKGLA